MKFNKELKTTKADKQTHGYGHLIIEDVINRLNGMVEYKESDGMFSVQLIIPIRNPVDNKK